MKTIQIVDVPDATPDINHAAWAAAFSRWERRRALPAELEALDRRDERVRLRSRNKGRFPKAAPTSHEVAPEEDPQ